MNDFLGNEEKRLEDVCVAVEAYGTYRHRAIAEFNAEMDGYRQELYKTSGQREREEIEARVRERRDFDPSLRMKTFDYPEEPYLAGLGIRDDDPKIGAKYYLLGKQGLSGENSRQIIVDWRQAAISKLYYLYGPEEEYEEQIGARERTGTITDKVSYVIKRRNLLQVQKNGESYKRTDGGQEWSANDAQRTIERKEQSGDFAMTDIIALISREQFEQITLQHSGCFYIQGGAGTGKTTVAIHRLSFLRFNYPDTYRAQRCLIVMFNKALRQYVHQTSQDLLADKMSVETYNSWAEAALRQCGERVQFQIDKRWSRLTPAKKSAAMHHAISEFLSSHKTTTPLADLGLLYSNEAIINRHFGGNYAKLFQEQGREILDGAVKAIPYDDAGPLLLFAQQGKSEVVGANIWYDHIVIDEAQDLSLVELFTLYGAAGKAKSMTICADDKQKILDFVDDRCFSEFHEGLQAKGLALGSLGVSYRSTKQIMAWAGHVSGKPVENVVSEGLEPKVHSFATEEESLSRLNASLTRLRKEEPQGLVAVICRWKQDIDVLMRGLRGVPGLRREMTFSPGVIVTNVHQVKGLEFSDVVIWNPTKKNYPETRMGRNLLYVAITRASKRIAVYHHEIISTLLPQGKVK